MKTSVLSFISNYCIVLYVAILFAERLQSIIRSFNSPSVQVFGNAFNSYVYVFSIASLVASLIILFALNQPLLKSLFTMDLNVHSQINLKSVCLLIGVILLSGMVHTEYTINGLQFAAYGILIVALILQTIINQASCTNIGLLWLSLIYLICFSMAIPVVYHSNIKMHILFHIIEAIVSIVLVFIFAWMSYKVFNGESENLFYVIPILITIIGDSIILALRWKEQVNTFVLIFLIASTVLWIAGKILSVKL